MAQLNFDGKQLEHLVDGLLAVGDRNKDGKVSFEEYVASNYSVSQKKSASFTAYNTPLLFLYEGQKWQNTSSQYITPEGIMFLKISIYMYHIDKIYCSTLRIHALTTKELTSFEYFKHTFKENLY